jgi:hypothetical protein
LPRRRARSCLAFRGRLINENNNSQ